MQLVRMTFLTNLDLTLAETSGQCYKTLYGRNYVAIVVTQSKS
jgi:hypothetical protein